MSETDLAYLAGIVDADGLRHATQHFARAVTNERVVYILHSHECLASHADLCDCALSNRERRTA